MKLIRKELKPASPFSVTKNQNAQAALHKKILFKKRIFSSKLDTGNSEIRLPISFWIKYSRYHLITTDLRREPSTSGRRTTNLALTSRGMAALRQVGVAEEIAPYQVAMFARMVHEVDGAMHPLYYGRKEQVSS